MARPGWPERNKASRSFRQLRRFHHVINSDKVFGTHNGFAERLIGSIRRECVDHVIVPGEMHLRQVLKSYAVLAATGYNFRRLIRWFRLLWRQILAALFSELLINLA